MSVGLSVAITFSIVAIIGTLAILVFKIFITKVIATFGSIIGGIANAMLIMILSILNTTCPIFFNVEVFDQPT